MAAGVLSDPVSVLVAGAVVWNEKLAGTLLDAQVDLNPHQVEAALFAFRSPLSKGAILADEVGLGKSFVAAAIAAALPIDTIEVIVPASLIDQWRETLGDFGVHQEY